jgi:hypothetical protein
MKSECCFPLKNLICVVITSSDSIGMDTSVRESLVLRLERKKKKKEGSEESGDN